MHQTAETEMCREILAGAPIRDNILAVTPGGGKSSIPVILAENPMDCVAIGAGQYYEIFKDMSIDRSIYDNLNN